MKAGKEQGNTPHVFISSTEKDLAAYRGAARDAVIAADMLPVMMEYFPASGDRPPMEKCLEKVSGCDFLVAVVAHRYGWVPEHPKNEEHKSITWLEVEQAIEDGHEVLVFLVDENHPWPDEHREENQIAIAIREGRATDELYEKTKRNAQRLKEFKAWLGTEFVRVKFTTPKDLRGLVGEALRKWSDRKQVQPVRSGLRKAAEHENPDAYLRWLEKECSYIDIRGLQVGTVRAHRIPIEDLFITLTTSMAPTGIDAGSGSGSSRGKRQKGPLPIEKGMGRRDTVPLHQVLQNDRLILVGDPGSGKTTFLRRVALALCQSSLGEKPNAAEARLGISDRTFPIFIRLSELAQHIRRWRGEAHCPATQDGPAWLPHFLAALSDDNEWGLSEEFFRERLRLGLCTVMADGLDEAPDRATRKRLARLIELAAGLYKGCRFVVTSRPTGYRGESVLPEFTFAEIDPLSDEATETFLTRWCEMLHPESRTAAEQEKKELLTALHLRPEIRRMARTPVMLTALAVVHWNERRLPEQRADLYDSIITWLSRSREQRPGRQTAERTVQLLQELALAMQNDSKGMRTTVPKRWAAEKLASHFGKGGEVDAKTIREAEVFLDAEMEDSGIIVERGNEIQFWHRTFQEFLAAKAIAGQTEIRQQEVLWGPSERLYAPEWSEVVLLLAGVLHGHGAAKVDQLAATMIDRVWPDTELAEQARCVGLLGAILRDLTALKFRVKDPRYEELRDRVMAIFDAKGSRNVPVEIRISAADALGQTGDPRIDPFNEEYWVTIPAGIFWMGAQKGDPNGRNYDDQAINRESPVHQVELDEFLMARFPVTVGQFEQFMDDGGYEDERWWGESGYGKFHEPEDWEKQTVFQTRPVTGVSWFEASAFSAWLNARLLTLTCRLPTEAEWERAARGTTAKKYPWGKAKPGPSRLNFDLTIGHTTPVGIYPLGNTPDGACDMAGNVYEWCADWIESYGKSQVENPLGAERGSLRVLRGGAWYDSARNCRAAYRDGNEPHERYVILGFRLAAVHVKQERGGEPEGRR